MQINLIVHGGVSKFSLRADILIQQKDCWERENRGWRGLQGAPCRMLFSTNRKREPQCCSVLIQRRLPSSEHKKAAQQ